LDQSDRVGANGTLLSNKSGWIKERNQTSSEMGKGCQRNGHRQRPIICQVVACAANQGVVVCGKAVRRKKL